MTGEVLSGGDLDLLLHKIAPVDFLGNRMFDLDTGVHFHEIEVAVIIDQKLDGAGIVRSRLFSASLIAASPILSLSSGVIRGDGHSSTIFWLRRWMEQSRSPRCTTRPCSSPKTEIRCDAG